MTLRLFLATLTLPAMLSPAMAAQEAPASLEIHIDQYCRIVQQDPQNPSRLLFHRDRFMCQIESPHDSQHWEGNAGQDQPQLVMIHEQEYVLHNTTGAPVTFVVAQYLPPGWHVDSVPEPVAIEDSAAIFRVQAEPGQTVRLHVGVRH